ncbi:MAG: carbohydrate binding domain-containing protein [Bacteroidaceae bacterium]|nr:carbohydrate binding domain-containing protein [Bacteroidaceae bacterium]
MKKLGTVLAAMAMATGVYAQNHVFDVNTSKVGGSIPSTMYGIFFEDINYAADGGLYGELVKNRSFEFPQNLMGWKAFGKYELKNDGPFKKNPHYVRLHDSGHRDKFTGLENEGFFGIGYQKNAEYRFTVWARNPKDDGDVTVRVLLCDPNTMSERQQFTEGKIVVSGKDWKKYEIVLKAGKTVDKGTLRLMLTRNSKTVDLEHVSLFPVDVYKGDANGLRKDLAQALEDLHPGVFRFPGGCIVEGTDLATRYQWKNSVGPVENRPLNENRWHYTFDYRFFPDYYQSYGLGFYEYFRLSEQIGAEPLPVLSVGLSCEFQNGDKRGDMHVDVDQLQPYIDDVLDLIEFANGDPAKNSWAKLRADMGHPAPFNLKYVAIGNEQWGAIYPENLKPFIEQVRKKYPNIKIIGTSGPDSEGGKFDYLWPEMRKLGVDLVDEHFYRNEEWFLKSGNRYDNYKRGKGQPKVFAGEYACHGKGKKWNHFNAALMEAAFMTDLERNADVVEMATYAPLFAHVDGWQWRPDAIWYDNLRSFNSCSYYVQQLYSLNKGTNMLSLTMNGKPVAGNDGQDGLFASAVFDKNTSEVIIKVINTGDKAQGVTFNLKGMKKGDYSAQLVTLHSDNLTAENTLDAPKAIVPQTKTVSVAAPTTDISVPARTFAIYKIKK